MRGTSSLGMDRRRSPPERPNSTEKARSKVIGATEHRARSGAQYLMEKRLCSFQMERDQDSNGRQSVSSGQTSECPFVLQ